MRVHVSMCMCVCMCMCMQAHAAQEQKRLLREAAERRERELGRARAQPQGAHASATAEAAPAPSLASESSIGAVIEAVLRSACPYRRLGMHLHAPRDACRRSYLQLALRLHPDKCSHPRAKEAFAAVEEAFRTVAGA